MPMDTYKGSSEQARCGVVATNSSAPSPCDLPPVQLKAILPLLQIELEQMQIDERSPHGEERFVDKDTLSSLAHALSPRHSILVPRHKSSTRVFSPRHDVFNRVGTPRLGRQAISPGSSAPGLHSRNDPNLTKGVSRFRPSDGDPSTRIVPPHVETP